MSTAILTMTLVAMVSLVESTGVYFAFSDICEKKLDSKDLSRGYRAEGLASIIGGIFNSFPYTTFSQNVGLTHMSGVKDRKVIYITGGLLVVLRFLTETCSVNNNHSNTSTWCGYACNVRYGDHTRYGHVSTSNG